MIDQHPIVSNKPLPHKKILNSDSFQYDKISFANHMMTLLLIILSSSLALAVSPQGQSVQFFKCPVIFCLIRATMPLFSTTSVSDSSIESMIWFLPSPRSAGQKGSVLISKEASLFWLALVRGSGLELLKTSLMRPKRKMMPSRISKRVNLLFMISPFNLRLKNGYSFWLFLAISWRSCSFSIFCRSHSLCNCSFSSSRAFTFSFFLSLDICADILFLCFLYQSSFSQLASTARSITCFFSLATIFLFLALFRLSRFFCLMILRLTSSQSTPLKLALSPTNCMISLRGVSQISTVCQRKQKTQIRQNGTSWAEHLAWMMSSESWSQKVVRQ